jgi:hypothetical protein
MSLNSVRAEFKAALDGVAGVRGYLARPTTPKSGDAWPIWGGGDRDESTGLFNDTWSVMIVVGADEQTANDWIDAHMAEVVTALIPVAYVDGRRPALSGPDGSPMYGLLINTSRE